MANLCRNGHDKGVVGCYANGACKECRRASSRAYYAQNLDKVRASAAASYTANRQQRIEYSRAWRKANPEKASAHARRVSRERAGIVDAHGEIRGGACEVCKKDFPSLVLDHDHSTGYIRGWLCTRCNMVLPLAENQELLGNALAYLAKERTNGKQ